MSFCASQYADCPNLQLSLDKAFTQRNISTITEKLGLVEFLMSDANRDGITQNQISPGGGKKRTIQYIYSPRIPKDEITDDCTRVCDSVISLGDLTENYEIDDDCVQFNWGININDLADRCEDDDLWLAKKVTQVMNGLLRRLEEKSMQQIATLFGSFAVGETNVVNGVKTVQTQNAANNPVIDFISEIVFASKNMAYKGAPVVFGWNEIAKAFTKLKATCCGDNGLNIAELAAKEGIGFIDSIEVSEVLGANNFMTMDVGAAQLIWYNEFMGPKGIRVAMDDSYVQGILVHPTLGLPFDWLVSNNCGTLSFQLKLATKVVGLPTDMFCNGDRLDAVTYINEYAITNP